MQGYETVTSHWADGAFYVPTTVSNQRTITPEHNMKLLCVHFRKWEDPSLLLQIFSTHYVRYAMYSEMWPPLYQRHLYFSPDFWTLYLEDDRIRESPPRGCTCLYLFGFFTSSTFRSSLFVLRLRNHQGTHRLHFLKSVMSIGLLLVIPVNFMSKWQRKSTEKFHSIKSSEIIMHACYDAHL